MITRTAIKIKITFTFISNSSGLLMTLISLTKAWQGWGHLTLLWSPINFLTDRIFHCLMPSAETNAWNATNAIMFHPMRDILKYIWKHMIKQSHNKETSVAFHPVDQAVWEWILINATKRKHSNVIPAITGVLELTEWRGIWKATTGTGVFLIAPCAIMLLPMQGIWECTQWNTGVSLRTRQV